MHTIVPSETHQIEVFIKENMECFEIQQCGFRELRSTLDQVLLCLDKIIGI